MNGSLFEGCTALSSSASLTVHADTISTLQYKLPKQKKHSVYLVLLGKFLFLGKDDEVPQLNSFTPMAFCKLRHRPYYCVFVRKRSHFNAFSHIVHTEMTENADKNGGFPQKPGVLKTHRFEKVPFLWIR